MKTWTTKSGCRIHKILALRSNAYLLSYRARNILVDTGPKRQWGRLDARLRAFGIDRLDHLILTHSHYDHADNALRVKLQYGASVIIHRTEGRFMAGEGMAVPGGTNAVTRYLVGRLRRVMAARGVEPCPGDILVDAVYDLSPLGLNAYVLPTPGHSPGSMSVVVDEEIAMVGDALFGVFTWSVLPPYADDMAGTVESWGSLLGTGCGLFLPGHGWAKTRAELKAGYVRRRVHS
jgi:hydroxyacylglutathione hydrolase